MKTREERWAYLLELDEKYLSGGCMLSEWTVFLVRDIDSAFCSGANLSAIIAAQSAIESHLRYEYSTYHIGSRLGFMDLIDQSPLDAELKKRLNALRKYRNKWVHVNDPDDDSELAESPERTEEELEKMASEVMDLLRKVVYLEQMI